VVLTTHLFLVPFGEWVGAIPLLPLCACIGMPGVTFTLILITVSFIIPSHYTFLSLRAKYFGGKYNKSLWL
jgi:hypothetical protein